MLAAQVRVQHRAAIEGGCGISCIGRASGGRGERAIKRNFFLTSRYGCMIDANACGCITARGIDVVNVQGAVIGGGNFWIGIKGGKLQIDLRSVQIARDVRIKQRAIPRGMRQVGRTMQRQRQGRCAAPSAVFKAKIAQQRIELSQIVRVHFNVDGRGAQHGICAEMSASHYAAGRCVQLQVTQIDGTVALCVGAIHAATGRAFAGNLARGRGKRKARVHGQGCHIAVVPVGFGRAIEQSVETEPLKGRGTDHGEQRVECDIAELRADFAFDWDGVVIRGLVVRGTHLERCVTRLVEPAIERDRAAQCAALMQMHGDGRDDQLMRVGMQLRVKQKIARHNARANVRGMRGMKGAIKPEAGIVARELDAHLRQSFGRMRVAGQWLDERHLELAFDVAAPAWMVEVIHAPVDAQCVFVGRDLGALQQYGIVLKIERGMKAAMHGRGSGMLGLPTPQIKIGECGFDVVALGLAGRGRLVAKFKMQMLRRKIERQMAALKVKVRGAIVVVEVTFAHAEFAHAQIEKILERVVFLAAPVFGRRCICRAVRVGNQMNARLLDGNFAHNQLGGDEVKNADAHTQMRNLHVGRFLGLFAAMQCNARGLCLELEQMPVKVGNLDPRTCGSSQFRLQPVAHKVFKAWRTGHEIGSNQQADEQCDADGEADRQMAQQKAPQAAWLVDGSRRSSFCCALVRGRAGRGLFAWIEFFAHCSPPVAGFLAGCNSRLLSRTSTAPCERSLLSQSPKRMLTCCCRRISSMRVETLSSGGTCSPFLYCGTRFSR